MRVYELAKQVNLSNKELINRFTELGVEVKSHSSSVDDKSVRMLMESMKEERAQKEREAETRKEEEESRRAARRVPAPGENSWPIGATPRMTSRRPIPPARIRTRQPTPPRPRPPRLPQWPPMRGRSPFRPSSAPKLVDVSSRSRSSSSRRPRSGSGAPGSPAQEVKLDGAAPVEATPPSVQAPAAPTPAPAPAPAPARPAQAAPQRPAPPKAKAAPPRQAPAVPPRPRARRLRSSPRCKCVARTWNSRSCPVCRSARVRRLRPSETTSPSNWPCRLLST